jgi:putative transposase
MTWRVTNVEEQKRLFISAYLEEKFNLSDLCRQFDISRPTAYKWIDRFKKEGWAGLKELSREPHTSPNKTPDALEEAILKVKYEYSKWGPKKILGYLENNIKNIKWPTSTTIENILKSKGLVKKRKLRKRLAKTAEPLMECNASNEVWSMDFKGWWLTAGNEKYEPFTLTDGFSRFLLCCEKLSFNNTTHVWAILERLFREYGLPLRIRSDNGPPFASLGAGRLSRLAVNLIKAGVTPEWIDPGEPQQNGRHERMHLTLEQEGVDLNLSLKDQTSKLEEFVQYYNFIRPHESLNQKTPSQIYTVSPRYWNGLLKSPEYGDEYKIGKVKDCGKMSWKNREIYIGRVLSGEPIGLKLDEEKLQAYYGPIFLGIVKENTLEIERRLGRKKLNF